MITVGDVLPPFRIASIDPEAMKVWAVALHDPNAIHLDRDRPECSTMVKYEQKLPSLGKYALKRAIKIKFGKK